MNRALDPRRARLVGRPSGLKGRDRDRCATGLILILWGVGGK